MINFYHIYLDPKPDITQKQIQEKMNLALNWFKYDAKNWVVYTTSDAKKWYTRLEPFFKSGGNVFISKFDINDYWGWMSKEFWEWLGKAPKEKY